MDLGKTTQPVLSLLGLVLIKAGHVNFVKTIISYLFGSIVVNLSCKNSHFFTVQELPSVSYTVGVEFNSLALSPCNNGNYYTVRAGKNVFSYRLRALNNVNYYTGWKIVETLSVDDAILVIYILMKNDAINNK